MAGSYISILMYFGRVFFSVFGAQKNENRCFFPLIKRTPQSVRQDAEKEERAPN